MPAPISPIYQQINTQLMTLIELYNKLHSESNRLKTPLSIGEALEISTSTPATTSYFQRLFTTELGTVRQDSHSIKFSVNTGQENELSEYIALATKTLAAQAAVTHSTQFRGANFTDLNKQTTLAGIWFSCCAGNPNAAQATTIATLFSSLMTASQTLPPQHRIEAADVAAFLHCAITTGLTKLTESQYQTLKPLIELTATHESKQGGERKQQEQQH